MAIHFTEKQTQVLNARGHNVLVCAAAGSGKTAVLVERIVRMITEGEHPLDIDHLLVVTFTKAAAAQMRERIAKAVSDRLLLNPGDRHLQRQETLLHRAQIMTIDSFCTFLLRNNFSSIGLDPGFRQMDETESALLEADVMKDFLEEQYQKNDPAFRHLSACVCSGVTDDRLEGLIMQLFNASNAHPSQKAWLLAHQRDYAAGSEEELLASSWYRELLHAQLVQLSGIPSIYEAMERVCEEPGGPGMWLDFLQGEESGILQPFGTVNPEKELSAACSAMERERLLPEDVRRIALQAKEAAAYAFNKIPTVRKGDGVDPDKKKAVTTLRDALKKDLKKMQKGVLSQSTEEILLGMETAREPVNTLITLTLGYIDALDAAKKEKNVIDFADLERLSLHVLLDMKESEDGEITYTPTAAAKALQQYYDEILIDEYQDSNEVQELLLSTVAGEREGSRRRFMVGDVKQSIYRFRNARPEIFAAKSDTYQVLSAQQSQEGAADCERIDLDQNFRSRREVLESVNDIFMRIMRKEIGGVEYGEDVSLKTGASYPAPPAENQEAYATECILVQDEGDAGEEENAQAGGGDAAKDTESGERSTAAGNEKGTGDHAEKADAQAKTGDVNGQDGSSAEKEQSAPVSARRKEAMAVVHRIKGLVGVLPISDESASGGVRPARYGDVVVLLRSFGGGILDIYRNVFEKAGIPLYVDYRTGYFSAQEVREIMQMLRILDNPRQDIPLYGALHGYFGQFSEEETAQIRAAVKAVLPEGMDVSLWDALHMYAGDSPEGEKAEKKEAWEARRPVTETEHLSGQSGEKRQGESTDGFGDASRVQNAEVTADPSLRTKVRSFLERYEAWRQMSVIMPVHDVVSHLLYDTGFEEYISALPSGPQRRANLHALVIRAQEFEKTQYTGLFNFLRYIDKCHSQDVDYGEANTLDENADVVRIMTIHKSKGLEFPICFVSGLSRKFAFRTMDAGGLLVCDADLGIGAEAVDPDARVHWPTMRKTAVQEKIMRESLGEELRVLYVAMTRAKEKLVLTGTISDSSSTEGRIAKAKAVTPEDRGGVPSHLSAEVISSASSYMDLCRMAFAVMSDQEKAHFHVYAVQDADLAAQENIERETLQMRKSTLLSASAAGRGKVPLPSVSDALEQQFTRRYAHEDLDGLFTKTTVTALKRAAIEEEEEGEGAVQEAPLPAAGQQDPYIPRFARAKNISENEQERLTGAQRGTAVHRCCELFDYQKWPDPGRVTAKEFQEWAQESLKSGRMDEAYKDVLRFTVFRTFLHSDLAARMARAAQSGDLWREQPFVLGVPASRMDARFPEKETVLVQGIIDAFFIEDGKIVLADYKTDYVTRPEELKERYSTQLDIYADALTRILHREVKEKIIYSFRLGQEIRV